MKQQQNNLPDSQAKSNKNLTALEDAQDKVSDKTKEALKRAIDVTKSKQTQIQQHRDTGTQDKSDSNVKDDDRQPIKHNSRHED
jgi:hypothetical protein